MPILVRFSALFLVVLFMGPSPFLRAEAASAATANSPAICTYRWGISGLNKKYYDAYEEWLNRPALWAEDFQPTEDWNNVRGGSWQIGGWSKWVQEKPGRRLVLSVVLLPGGWDGKGPARGLEAGTPVSLAEGAKGTYNQYFEQLGQTLVEHGLANTVLRLGWEFNGGWYTFRASGKEKEFAEYWKQIVTTMRAVPGQQFVFNWNPTLGWEQFPADKAWPGDEFVDEIGVDVYDQSWIAETYPLPKDADEKEIQRRREKVWNERIYGGPYGLKYWVDFAREHKKPLSIPEWGVCNRQDGHGGGDNRYFVEQMGAFITNPDNNITWHCYFDVNAGDGAHQLVSDNENPTTAFPKAAESFQRLFALPAK